MRRVVVTLLLNDLFCHSKAWFSYVWKIPDDRGPTIPDFADSDIGYSPKVCPRFLRDAMLIHC